MKTDRNSFKKIKGKIIILEGLWGVGKTTLCQYFQKYFDFCFFQEPNHIKAGLKTKDRKYITNWYFKEHLKNLKRAFELASKKKNVVIERSPISSLAFAKAFFNEDLFTNKSFSEIESLSRKYKNQPYLVILKDSDFLSLAKRLSKNKQMAIYSDIDFLRKFQKYLLIFANLLEKHKCFNIIKLKPNKDLRKSFQKIISKIL